MQHQCNGGGECGWVATPIRCVGRCGFDGPLAAHHDRLLEVDRDPEAVLDLMELAVTWGELDYSDVDVIGPSHWLEFGARHSWRDPGKAMRAFELADDIARARTLNGAPPDRLRTLTSA